MEGKSKFYASILLVSPELYIGLYMIYLQIFFWPILYEILCSLYFNSKEHGEFFELFGFLSLVFKGLQIHNISPSVPHMIPYKQSRAKFGNCDLFLMV